MRICFITDAGSVHAQRWVRYFVERGHKVFVLSERYIPIEGAQVVDFCKLQEGLIWKIPKLRRIVRFVKFRHLINDFKPDIVHIFCLQRTIHNIYYYRGIKNLVISTWGSDIVWDFRMPEPFSLHFYKRVLLSQAKVITATSKFLTRVTARHSPPTKKVYTIPFGIDCEIFTPGRRDKRKERPLTLSFIKHLKPKYGPEILIRAFELVSRKFPDTRLFMVGSGWLEGFLKELTRELKLEKKIIFTGEIPHYKVPKILEGTDIFVMPSVYLSESFGVAALEAEAMEIPVIATKVGGVPEVVVDGVTGILVEPQNVEQLAEAVIALIESPDSRERMGKEGRKFVLKNYVWQENASRMGKLYSSIVRNARR